MDSLDIWHVILNVSKWGKKIINFDRNSINAGVSVRMFAFRYFDSISNDGS